MSAKNVRKGDTVILLSGKDKGRRGKVLRVAKDGNKVLVENLNIAKRHTKQGNNATPGGIVDKPMPVSVSNVMLFCGQCNKPTRVTRFKADDHKSTRMCRKCGASLDK